MIDSGTTLMYIPDAAAASINSQLGATDIGKNGTWVLPCSQVPNSSLSFFLGGSSVALTINIKSLFIPLYPNSLSCNSVLRPSSEVGGLIIFGVLFIQNWYTAFDYSKATVNFAKTIQSSSVQRVGSIGDLVRPRLPLSTIDIVFIITASVLLILAIILSFFCYRSISLRQRAKALFSIVTRPSLASPKKESINNTDNKRYSIATNVSESTTVVGNEINLHPNRNSLLSRASYIPSPIPSFSLPPIVIQSEGLPETVLSAGLRPPLTPILFLSPRPLSRTSSTGKGGVRKSFIIDPVVNDHPATLDEGEKRLEVKVLPRSVPSMLVDQVLTETLERMHQEADKVVEENVVANPVSGDQTLKEATPRFIEEESRIEYPTFGIQTLLRNYDEEEIEATPRLIEEESRIEYPTSVPGNVESVPIGYDTLFRAYDQQSEASSTLPKTIAGDLITPTSFSSSNRSYRTPANSLGRPVSFDSSYQSNSSRK